MAEETGCPWFPFSLFNWCTLGFLMGYMAINSLAFLPLNCGHVIYSSLEVVRETYMIDTFKDMSLKGGTVLFIPPTLFFHPAAVWVKKIIFYLFKGILTQVSISCSWIYILPNVKFGMWKWSKAHNRNLNRYICLIVSRMQTLQNVKGLDFFMVSKQWQICLWYLDRQIRGQVSQ